MDTLKNFVVVVLACYLLGTVLYFPFKWVGLLDEPEPYVAPLRQYVAEGATREGPGKEPQICFRGAWMNFPTYYSVTRAGQTAGTKPDNRCSAEP